MNKKLLQNIVGGFTFVSICLPLLFLKSYHDCRYDKCFRLFHNDRMGMCVEKAIDDMYMAIAVAWSFVIYGSAIVLSKNINSISPFVIIGFIIILSSYGAFIDPNKWLSAIALLPSTIGLIIATYLDSKEETRKKNDGLRGG